MSILEKTNRLITAQAAVKLSLKTALEAKGVVVSDEKLKDYPSLVSQIKNTSGTAELNIVISAEEPENPVENMIWITPDDIAEYVVNTIDATATAEDILSGKTAFVKGELITGTYVEAEINSSTGNFYNCIAVNQNNKTWQGANISTGETETLTYTVAPEIGYIYDSTGKIYIEETRRDLGFDIYRRRINSSDMGGYNLGFVDEIDNSYNSNKGYYFYKVKNRRFKDYTVPGEYGSYALAIKNDGNLYSWGSYTWGDCISGQGGALSNSNPNKTTYEPRLADASGNWERIFAIYQNTWVLNSDGELYRCGRNEYGELGFGDSQAYWKLTKLEIAGVTKWKKVALYEGTYRTYLLSEDGRLFVSGNGSSYGELGLGSSQTSTNTFKEIKVDGVTAWSEVFSGNYNAGAITDDGRLFVWGSNSYGQLGLGEGNSDNQYVPIQIGADKTWISASFGQYHLIAVASDGTLWGTGRATECQLGLGPVASNQNSLVQIGTKDNWKYVKSYSSRNLLIDNDNKVYYCGGSSAMYGGGSSSNEAVPTYHGYKIGNYKRCDFERILTAEWDGSDIALLDYFRSGSNLTIPDGTTYISKQPLQDNGYGSYSTIYIPKSVTSITSDAFSSFYSTNVIFEAEQAELPTGYPWGHQGGDSYFTYGASFEHVENNEVLSYIMGDNFPSDYTFEIPDGVTSIYYKFQNYQSITILNIPDSITSLESAFNYCTNLSTVYIGNISDSSYFMSPFYGCSNLTTIYCDWVQGEKPNVESQAPWGASNATVVYKS